MEIRALNICAGNLFGGVETFLTTLARAQDSQASVKFDFAVCFPGRLLDELRRAGAVVHSLGPARLSRPWTVSRARRALGHVFDTSKYHVVVAQMQWTKVLFGKTVRAARLPLVCHLHGPNVYSILDYLAAYTKPSLLIGPSVHTVHSYQPLYPTVPSLVLNNPIPHSLSYEAPLSEAERCDIRAELGASPAETVILQASRMEEWKGPDLTLRALAALKEIPTWRLWIAGDAQRSSEIALLSRLRDMARECGIDNRVRFLGERRDIARLMQASDIYCQGNRGSEGFSLAFLEASVAGLPIVTTNIGGASEMVGSENGILVRPSEDTTELTEALRTLILNPAMRSRLGREGRRKALRLCDTNKQVALLSEALASVARGNLAKVGGKRE
jgi:glycosyltransferase involved in cell wall biosynthesis